MMNLPQVCVCYLLRPTDEGTTVLLGRKKKGLGVGKIVAPGGKLEPGETAIDAAVREVEEESGLVVRPSDLEFRGRLRYLFPHHQPWSQESTVFVCRRFSGEVSDSDELELRWVPIDAVPLERMWDDAQFWLPGVLRGGHVRRTFRFGVDLDTVAPDQETRDGRACAEV